MPKIDTSVGKLVQMIQDGELRLPEMQRRYVWPATRVRDLLDSLYRGYPSGTILVWETDREMPSRDLAVSQRLSPLKGHTLLLDGQQRLTSLSAILRCEPVVVRNRRRPIEILFNLDHPDGPPVEVIEVEDDALDAEDNGTESEELEEDEDQPNIQERLRSRTFVVASRALMADPRWVKVSEIFKDDADTQILKRLVKSFDDPLFDRYSKRLQAVRRIRDYPYVMHVLDKNLSYEEVAEIFVRVNSLGMKLRGSDLALAQITSRWQDSLRLFEEFQEECEESWFTLDLGLIVRALVVFTTGQSRFKTTGGLPIGALKKGWEDAKHGVRFAINFLRANAGIEDESLLSSPLFIITLGYFASRHGFSLNPAEESGLRRWVYTANGRGHYTRGSSETTLDTDLNVIDRKGGSGDLLKVLESQVGRLEVQAVDVAGRGQRSALFSMAFLAMKAQGAKDWRTRLGLSLTHQGRYHFIEHHHIFPKALLKKAGYQTSEINEIGNMAFVTGSTNRKLSAQPPEVYLAEVVRDQGEKALQAHCIPTDASLWSLEAFPKFLEYRRAAIAEAINRFVAQTEDIPPEIDLEALIAAGESSTIEFKSSARWDFKEERPSKLLEAVIVKTLAGFMNSGGGVLLIGVSDDGAVVGLERDFATLSKRPDRDGYQQFLVHLVSRDMGAETCACLSISFHPVRGMEVCRVSIEPGPKPVYIEDGAATRFFVRTGNLTQELSTRASAEYIAERWKRA